MGLPPVQARDGRVPLGAANGPGYHGGDFLDPYPKEYYGVKKMSMPKILWIILFLVVGYFIGVKYPHALPAPVGA